MKGFWGSYLRILRPYLGFKGHPQTDRMTGFMFILEIDPPCLVTLNLSCFGASLVHFTPQLELFLGLTLFHFSPPT
jgi:hypothetical protein